MNQSFSVCARGPGAEELVAGHELAPTPFGAGTPFARLIERGAHQVYFGSGVGAITMYHAYECLREPPYPIEVFLAPDQIHILRHLAHVDINRNDVQDENLAVILLSKLCGNLESAQRTLVKVNRGEDSFEGESHFVFSSVGSALSRLNDGITRTGMPPARSKRAA